MKLPEYWDWVAEHSFHLRQPRPTVTDIYYRKLVLTLINQLGSGRWGRVLKLDAYNEATNTQYGFHLLEKAADLILVDISLGISKRACLRALGKGLNSNVHLIVADFRRLPLRPECVDMSCSFGSIEHVPEYERAFYEQARVVKEGSEVFVGVPNMLNFSLRVLFTRILNLMGLMQKMTNPEKHFVKPQLLSLAKSLKLSGIVFSGYHLFPKQLRWLDLWMDARGQTALRRSRLFLWLLKTFTLIELRYSFARNFAEMIIVKGVKEWGRDRGQRSLSDVEISIAP
ncbi:MAG: methyltransferase domain-containing protein [Nitrososphaerota archaeon]|nr:methyltransferase domain-containing protein [Nitrososphaerota archaeon]